MVAAALPVVAVAGSRRLPAGAALQVATVARALARAGRRLAVGCCIGADAAVLSAGVPPAALEVFAAFGAGAAGACALSAVEEVAAVAAAGAAVQWWAGGGAAVPLSARLALRSRAVAAAATAGAVLFPASPTSAGTVSVARAVARRGLPVLVFPLGFPAAALPLLKAGGAWVPAAGAGLWAGALRWVPAAPAENLVIFS